MAIFDFKIITYMKRFIFSLAVLIVLASHLQGQTTVKALRVLETLPNTSAWVLSGQEQLTGQAFQQDALISYNGFQYTVYYNATRNVTIARRALPSGTWKEVVLPHRNTADDAHNVISMGICKNDGTIHLSYDHHNTTLRYCRSKIGLAHDASSEAWTASAFGTTTSQLVPGVSVPDVTYPRFIEKPDGNLLFECRYKLSGDGDSYLREYDGSTHSWSHIGRYVQGMDASPNACAYINRMDYDVNGRLHVSWCWRDDFGGGSNHDLYYGYSDDHGRTWKDTHGQLVATTESINPTDSRASGTCMRQGLKSLQIEAIPYNKGYINQETQATDSKGRVHIVNSYMTDGTDSNWASSRRKAVLHHRYRDLDGTWHHNLVRKNGQPVNSNCRVQVICDAFDNAYVIANGAEIYAATSANQYTDWGLLSDVDLGRFCSEPQIDRNAVDEGILSFVYLGRDKKVAVIDYLIDNPHRPDGKGLNAEYFSDKNLSQALSQTEGVLPGAVLPDKTESVRWSGVLETSLGEAYTLHLTTTAPVKVFINGQRVLDSGTFSGLQTFNLPLKAINSHKNNLVITAVASTDDSLQLAWSSARTTRSLIPSNHFYPNQVPQTDVVIEPPLLPVKADLAACLVDGSLIEVTDSKKKIIQPERVDLPADYSLDLTLTLHDASGRGVDLSLRRANGKGLRMALGLDSIAWLNPLKQGTWLGQLTPNRQHRLRVAVLKDSLAHVYLDGHYLNHFPVFQVYDLDSTGLNEVPQTRAIAPSDPLNLIGNPTFASDVINTAPTGWLSQKPMGGGTNPRVQVNNAEWPNQSVFTFRFDNDASYGTWFAYPVNLTGNTWYEFAWDNVNWGGNTGQYEVVVSTQAGGNGVLAGLCTIEVPSTRRAIETRFFRFKTLDLPDGTTFYLTFRKAVQMGTTGISNLTLTPQRMDQLFVGKNYTDGSLKATVHQLSVDETGAFAPALPTVLESSKQSDGPQLYGETGSLTLTNLTNNDVISIYDLNGRCLYQKNRRADRVTIPLVGGFYLVQVVNQSGTFTGKAFVR